MGTTAREDISTTKKELVSSKGVVFAPRTIQFAHQFVGTETSVNLLSLVTPTLLTSNGFVNATPQEIAAANLSVFGKNLKISLSRGIELKPYVHYLIVNNNIVFIGGLKDNGGALVDEMMFGEIQMASGGAQIVGDVRFVRGTVEVAVGQTLVNIGDRFKVNENPGSQVGAVRIVRNGVTIYRNVGNAVASPSADGNYQEIDSGTGYGVSIQLNVAPAIQSDIIDYEIGIQLSSGDLALWDAFQKLQGSVLALSQDAAQEFYGDQDYTRYLTVAPSDLERKSYADLVIAQAARISVLENTKNRVQTKILSANVALNTTLGDLTFNNLVVGNWYELTGKIYFLLDFGANDDAVTVTINNGSFVVAEITTQIGAPDASTDAIPVPLAFKFQATATTVTFVTTDASANSLIVGNNLRSGTFAQLEERLDLIDTGAF